jgi:hypothetical protein
VIPCGRARGARVYARACPPILMLMKISRMEIQTGPGFSPWKPAPPDPEAGRRERRHEALMIGVRYVVPAAILVVGIVVFAVVPDREVAIDIGAMFVGVAIAVFLLNFFFRMGVSGEADRDREEEARAYFDAHGRWPDE